MNKYYEIIDIKYTGVVVGVTTEPNDCDEDGNEFGLISKKEFERYDNRPWIHPKSKRRFKLVPVPKKLAKV